MPHLVVEYSANLEPDLDARALLEALHQSADASGIFQPATIRSRTIRHETFIVGEGRPKDAFVHVSVRIRSGRDETTQWSLTNRLLAVSQEQLATAYLTHRIGLTVEIDIINPVRSLHSTLTDP